MYTGCVCVCLDSKSREIIRPQMEYGSIRTGVCIGMRGRLGYAAAPMVTYSVSESLIRKLNQTLPPLSPLDNYNGQIFISAAVSGIYEVQL